MNTLLPNYRDSYATRFKVRSGYYRKRSLTLKYLFLLRAFGYQTGRRYSLRRVNDNIKEAKM